VSSVIPLWEWRVLKISKTYLFIQVLHIVSLIIFIYLPYQYKGKSKCYEENICPRMQRVPTIIFDLCYGFKIKCF